MVSGPGGDSDGTAPTDGFTLGRPVDGAVRDVAGVAERPLRLILGGQILGKSHGGRVDQLWQLVKRKSGRTTNIASNGYLFPMGKKHPDQAEVEPMSIRKAISRALKEVLPKRGVLPLAKRIGLSNSTLRRLRDEELERIDAEHLVKLRRIARFSLEFDKLIGEADPDAEALDMARRILRAFPQGGGEAVIESVEDLAPELDPPAIAESLRTLKLTLRRHHPAAPTSKKLPTSAKKLPSGA